jgi:hypothetical protein
MNIDIKEGVKGVRLFEEGGEKMAGGTDAPFALPLYPLFHI